MRASEAPAPPRTWGIRANQAQFLHQLLQVLLVGMTLGTMRTVIPALAESEFGVPRQSFVLLTAFVLAFGVVKGAMNFLAGRLSERHGRRQVLLAGWGVALPIPILIAGASNWSWVVAATVLLGVHQGLTWSMTQTAKLDFTRVEERGLTLGLNELAGYVGVAVAGLATAALATGFGPRPALLSFGLGVILCGGALTLGWVRETLPWARAASGPLSATGPAEPPSTWTVFCRVSWQDRRLAALSQAGLVEKFVDVLIWVAVPVYLMGRGISLPQVGVVVGVYGLTWGLSQWLTGRLSDRWGRHRLNVSGMLVCGAGVALIPWGHDVATWSAAAALTGWGMAMLYPNLSAAVADIAAPAWRGSAIGVYRFWRDLGYALGALVLGGVAQLSGGVDATFGVVALAMALSAVVLAGWGEETHPAHRAR